MNESIFRKKSLERISSPEETDDYMKVASPSLWLVIAAIVLLLAAAMVWGITRQMETASLTENITSTTCLIKERNRLYGQENKSARDRQGGKGSGCPTAGSLRVRSSFPCDDYGIL